MKIVSSDPAERQFKKGDRVRYKAEFLASLSAAQAKRLLGRVGTVQGYRMGTNDPIVLFPRDGRRSEFREIDLRVRWLEAAPDAAPEGPSE